MSMRRPKADYSQFNQFNPGDYVRVITRRPTEHSGRIISNRVISKRLDLKMRHSARCFKYAEILRIEPLRDS